jgi:hypothetical protein
MLQVTWRRFSVSAASKCTCSVRLTQPVSLRPEHLCSNTSVEGIVCSTILNVPNAAATPLLAQTALQHTIALSARLKRSFELSYWALCCAAPCPQALDTT